MKSISPLSRGLGVALLLSLSLNGFLLTPGGKRFFRPDRQNRYSVESFAERNLSRLPNEADALRFKEVLAQHRDELAKCLDKAVFARDDLRQTLNAESFDRPAVEAALAKQQSASAEFQQLVRAIMLDAAEKLSREGRASLFSKR